jgi:hypothetical protein
MEVALTFFQLRLTSILTPDRARAAKSSQSTANSMAVSNRVTTTRAKLIPTDMGWER